MNRTFVFKNNALKSLLKRKFINSFHHIAKQKTNGCSYQKMTKGTENLGRIEGNRNKNSFEVSETIVYKTSSNVINKHG